MNRPLALLVNGERHSVVVTGLERDCVRFQIGERNYEVRHEYQVPQNSQAPTKNTNSSTARPSRKGQPGEILAPIPGVIVDIAVKLGDKVTAGQILLKLEAMKMQNSIAAQSDGTVAEISVENGDEVRDGQLLVRLT